jgi:hypothetical protein
MTHKKKPNPSRQFSYLIKSSTMPFAFVVFMMLSCFLSPINTTAQPSNFNCVSPTGLPFNIIIANVTLNDGPLQTNSEIVAFDGSLCVGSVFYDGSTNIQMVAWQGDASQGLAGYTPGNPIEFKVFTRCYSTDFTLDATPVFLVGNGTFGAGSFTVVDLSVEEAACVLPVVSCPPPSFIVAVSIRHNSALLFWDCDTSTYEHQLVGMKLGGGENFNKFKRQYQCPIFKRMSDLTPNTSYIWKVRTFCDSLYSDVSEWTGIDTFTTTCVPPGQIVASNVSANGVTLTWASAPDSYGYELYGKRNGMGGWQILTVSPANTSVTLNNLAASTEYRWKVRSICDMDTSRYSPFTLPTAFNTPSLRISGSSQSPEVIGEIRAFPNPFEESVVFQYDLKSKANIEIEIFDFTGKIVWQSNM